MTDEQIVCFLRQELEKMRAEGDIIDTVTITVSLFVRMTEVFIGHAQITKETPDFVRPVKIAS